MTFKTNVTLVYYYLWNHRIIEEKKIWLYSWHELTVGISEAFWYVVTNLGKYQFEAKNPGTLFVALLRAKSASGRGSDPDFAFHEDVLLNDDRLKLVNTPTTQARQTEMQGLRLLANQFKEMEAFSLAY